MSNKNLHCIAGVLNQEYDCADTFFGWAWDQARKMVIELTPLDLEEDEDEDMGDIPPRSTQPSQRVPETQRSVPERTKPNTPPKKR